MKVVLISMIFPFTFSVHHYSTLMSKKKGAKSYTTVCPSICAFSVASVGGWSQIQLSQCKDRLQPVQGVSLSQGWRIETNNQSHINTSDNLVSPVFLKLWEETGVRLHNIYIIFVYVHYTYQRLTA